MLLRLIIIQKKITINFFKTIQNKMHYAVSNNTAAEIVYNRVDSTNDIKLTSALVFLGLFVF